MEVSYNARARVKLLYSLNNSGAKENYYILLPTP